MSIEHRRNFRCGVDLVSNFGRAYKVLFHTDLTITEFTPLIVKIAQLQYIRNGRWIFEYVINLFSKDKDEKPTSFNGTSNIIVDLKDNDVFIDIMAADVALPNPSYRTFHQTIYVRITQVNFPKEKTVIARVDLGSGVLPELQGTK